MFSVILKLYCKLYLPGIYLYLFASNIINKVIHSFTSEKIYINKKYTEGDKIIILVVYENSILRNDISRLINTCKAQCNLYLMVINNSKLDHNEIKKYENKIDCYVERNNYGRDFGAYKFAFEYLFKNNMHLKSDRVIMLNDSVYYDTDRLQNFLDEFLNTQMEVLGATENYEIEHHLGSFAISLSNKIINNNKFIKYWKYYKNSNTRPTVIKKGEMGLSKVLFKISKYDAISSIYSVISLRKYLEKNEDNVFEVVKILRKSRYVDWPVLESKILVESFLCRSAIKKISHDHHHIMDGGLSAAHSHESTNLNFKDDSSLHLGYITEINEIDSLIKGFNLKSIEKFKIEFIQYVINLLVEYSKFGSQIHQNNAVFLKMGCPLIKLDGIYRGMFVEEDVYCFSKLIDIKYFDELYYLLIKKPFGGLFLKGWKREAFKRGLI